VTEVKMVKFGKLLWLAPKSLAGENPMSAWRRYLERRGTWEITTDPSEEADIIFFGSDSVLDGGLLQRDAVKIAYFWDVMPSRCLDPGFRAWLGERVGLMRRCDFVLTPSLFSLGQANLLGLRALPCTPGVDSELIDSVPDQEEEFQVCAVGRLTPHKQHEWILWAASMIRPKPPRVRIVGAGDPKPLKKLAERLGVECEAGPLGDGEKIREIKRSVALVTASAHEGFGYAGPEALYCGKPVLALDTPIHREILKEYAGYFTGAEDLARKLAQLLNDPALRRRLGEEGREYVSRNLTFERATDRLEEVLEHAFLRVLGKRVRTERDPRRWAEVYDANLRRELRYRSYRFDPNWSRYWEPRELIKILRNHGVKRVLDVGSGAVHPVIFALNGFEVAALDCSPETVRVGKEIASKHGVGGRITWRQGFAEQLPFEDSIFDAVVQTHLWEHLHEPERAVAEGMRVLRPSGILVGAVPLGTHHFSPLHLRTYSVRDVEELCRPFGEILELRTIGEPLRDPSVILVVVRKCG